MADNLQEAGMQARTMKKVKETAGKTPAKAEAETEKKEYITDPYAKKVLERLRASREAALQSAKSEFASVSPSAFNPKTKKGVKTALSSIGKVSEEEEVDGDLLSEGPVKKENKAKSQKWAKETSTEKPYGKPVSNREASKYNKSHYNTTGMILKKLLPGQKVTNAEIKRASPTFKEDFDLLALINEQTADVAAHEFNDLISGALTQKFYQTLDVLRDLTAERLFNTPEDEVSTEAVVEALLAAGVDLTEEQIDDLLEYTLFKPWEHGANRKGVINPGAKVRAPLDKLRQKYNLPAAAPAPTEKKIGRRPAGMKMTAKEGVDFSDLLSSVGLELTEAQVSVFETALHENLLAEELMADVLATASVVAEHVGFTDEQFVEYVALLENTYQDDLSPLFESVESYLNVLDLSDEGYEALAEAVHLDVRKDRSLNKMQMAARNAEDKGDWATAAKHWKSAAKSSRNSVAYKQLKARHKEVAAKAAKTSTPRVRPTVKKGIIDRVKAFFSRKKVAEEYLDLLTDVILENFADVDEISDEDLVEMIQAFVTESLEIEDLPLFEDEALEESSHLSKMRKERDDDEHEAKKADRKKSLEKFEARRGKELKREDLETVAMFALAEAMVEDLLADAGVEPEYLEELSKKTLGSYVKKAVADNSRRHYYMTKDEEDADNKYAEFRKDKTVEKADAYTSAENKFEKQHSKYIKRNEKISQAVDKLSK